MGACRRTPAHGKEKGSPPASWPCHQPGCPGARRIAKVQPQHGAEGRTPPAAPATSHGLCPSLIKIAARLRAVNAGRRLPVPAGQWGFLFWFVTWHLFYQIAALERFCSWKHLPTALLAPASPQGLAGSRCSHPTPLSDRARTHPRSLQPSVSC